MEVEARLAAKKEAARQAEARAAEIIRRREKDSRDSPRSTHSRSSSLTPPSFASLKKAQQMDQVHELPLKMKCIIYYNLSNYLCHIYDSCRYFTFIMSGHLLYYFSL